MLTDYQVESLSRIIGNAEPYSYFVLAVYQHPDGCLYYEKQGEDERQSRLIRIPPAPSTTPDTMAKPDRKLLKKLDILPDGDDENPDEALRRIFS